MPTKSKSAPKTAAKLPASVQLTITYPAKLFMKEVDKGVVDTIDKKIVKIVGRATDASGCDVASVRGAKRDLRWWMIRRLRVPVIEKAVAALAVTGLKVVASERKAA